MAILGLLFVSLGTTTAAAKDVEVVVASGTLEGQFLASALFHIDEFWMRVGPDTEFHRWLSQGLDRKVVILLTTQPARFDDVKNVRILSGTLIHETTPTFTSAATNVIGRFPEGDSSFVHVLFLKDEITGSIGAVTFETADRVTADNFDAYANRHINIVIVIE